MIPFDRKKLLIATICNGSIFLLTCAACVWHYFLYGLGSLIYFTEESNIFCGLAGLAACVDGIGALKEKRRLHLWALLLKYAGTIGLAVTFLTVMCFLGPVEGYASMFTGGSIYFHGLGPILAMVSFIHFDGCGQLQKRIIPVGMLPVILYGIIYAYNVLVSRAWPDFYGFTSFAPWYVACLAMAAAAFLCSLIILLLHNKAERPGTETK